MYWGPCSWLPGADESYYFTPHGLAMGALDVKVSFTVPTGNFWRYLTRAISRVKNGAAIADLVVAKKAERIFGTRSA